MSIKQIACAATVGMTLFCAAAQAADITPNFSTVPAGWTTDRYAPNSFANVGTFQGRDDVLGIGISSNDSLANRPAPYKFSFYNTQGKAHAAAGGAGSILAADLYIPEAWRSAANGDVRTDMWGVMSNAANDVSDYTIIGFTNYGAAGARLRAWDSDGGDWVDLASVTSFDNWMSLAIDFTGSSYVYSVNGATVFTDNTIGDTTHFSSVLMQAYNFGDPSIAGANPVDYTAHWSNAVSGTVPEPGSVTLLAIGLFGYAASRRRSSKRARG